MQLAKDRQAEARSHIHVSRPYPSNRLPSHTTSVSLPLKTGRAFSSSYEERPLGSLTSDQAAIVRRARACTSPMLPSHVADHQVWFDDPRFDGSFPSRVLPFLYLGNLCAL